MGEYYEGDRGCIRAGFTVRSEMKIALITNYWKNSDGGGVKTFLVNLVDALKNKGVDVSVLFRGVTNRSSSAAGRTKSRSPSPATGSSGRPTWGWSTPRGCVTASSPVCSIRNSMGVRWSTPSTSNMTGSCRSRQEDWAQPFYKNITATIAVKRWHHALSAIERIKQCRID